ncbi:biotin/lipoyl-containing protein [Conexibacter sp. CPCC 206217]|uniref:biotin/lipoyl-containing protein n=1 Tax=Conexibacter sp. CPCC 206217 TaxID=3064574 RepID=UPI002717B0E6|nr:biotin/lipoyl-containing protein [Conexibacter sp. CPCC 206217]MDO8212415.1 biotin/lipoyl-containing protein [Conexibacter sp. CPCC 206217]
MRVEVAIEDPGSHEEIEVVEVMVEVGEEVEQGDVLLEVSTDKANMDVEAPSAGTVTEVLVSEGDVVPSRSLLVVLEG